MTPKLLSRLPFPPLVRHLAFFKLFPSHKCLSPSSLISSLLLGTLNHAFRYSLPHSRITQAREGHSVAPFPSHMTASLQCLLSSQASGFHHAIRSPLTSSFLSIFLALQNVTVYTTLSLICVSLSIHCPGHSIPLCTLLSKGRVGSGAYTHLLNPFTTGDSQEIKMQVEKEQTDRQH